MNRTQFTGLLAGLVLMLGAQVASATCTITPLHSVVNAGESVTLTATCDSAVTEISWTEGVTTVAGPLSYSIPASSTFSFHTPFDLSTGSHAYNVNVKTGATTNDTGSDVEVVVQPAVLKVAVAGAGSGSVSSLPAGIDCGSICSANSFNNSAMVTLTPTPDSSSSFTGWSGDCTGNGACTVVMAVNRNVTANFSNAPINGACNTTTTGIALTAQPSSNQSCTSGNYLAGTNGSTAVTWTCQGINAGAQDASCSAPRAYSITPTAGTNGSISPSSVQTVAYNVPVQFTAQGTGSYTPTFSTGGTACPGSANGITFTTGTLTSDCTVDANFSLNPVNGACNTTTTGTALTAQPSSNQSCTSGTYVAGTNTTSTVPWSCAGANGGTTANCSAVHGYTVTPSAGSGGSISPNSAQVVAYNTTKAFTVTPNSGNMATMGGSCGGSMSGSTYTTSAITTNCTVQANFSQAVVSTTDPGKWTGLWIPPNTNNVIVADQMSPQGAGSANFIPGCLNQQTSVAGGCSTKLTYTDIVYGTNTRATVVLANNNILSIRYTSKSNPNATYSSFLLGGGSGGNLPTTVYMWLSTSPGVAMSSVPTKCQTTSTSSARISTGTGYCVVTPDTPYYLNIQVPATTCAACMFKLTDDSQFY